MGWPTVRPVRFALPFRRAVRRHRVAAIGAAVLVAAGAVGLMYARGSTAAPQYRTATATLGTVRQTLSLTGNLTPVAQENLNFQVSGTVTAIDVSAGQTVTAGQVLARVDPTSLQATLTQAQANFTAAQAKQAADQSSSSTAAQVATARTTLANDETAYTDTVAVSNQTLSADQQAISADQAAVDRDDRQVASAQQQYNSDGCGAGASSPACQSDQQSLSAAQQQQGQDQRELATAQTALQTDRVRTRQSNDAALARVNSDRTALSNAASGAGNTGTAVSAAASAAQDAATVSQAELAVTAAQDAVDNAVLTTPMGGEVAQVNTAVGDAVGAGSTSSSSTGSAAQFIVLTPGSFQVTSTVSDSVVSEVAVGQRAIVTAAGSTNGLPATVSSVGVIATVTSGVATFPVTVQITDTHPALRDGMSATVTVVVNQVVGVLTVPTSAVHTSGTTSTVQVLKNGVASAVPVTVGAADPSRTQITSGLSAGDTVVIATVSSTVPSTTAGGGAQRRGGFGGGGGGGFAPPGT